MKKLKYGLLGLLLIGCAPKERFVKVAEDVLPKSVFIQVSGIAEVPMLAITETNGEFSFEITKATVPVTYLGAGVFISPNGHILTVHHLFDMLKVTGITVCQYDGTCQGAEILEQDERKDLALIRVEGPTPHYARIGDPRDLKVGQEVLAVGTPLGLEFSVSHGIISALHRDFEFRYDTTQSDTSINPGNSGGPLFNLKGELVGINSFMIPPVNAPVFTGLGFSASPGEMIKFITRIRERYSELPRLNLGYWEGLKNALGYR